MGFISDLLKAAGVFAEAAVYAVGTVAAYVGTKAAKFVQITKEAYQDYKSKNIHAEKQSANSSLFQINGRIIDLESKKKKNGSLTNNDSHELAELYAKRRSLVEEKNSLNEVETAKDISDNPSDFNDVAIDDQKIHILQFHVGQTVSNKKCPKCRKSMQVQWKKGITHAGTGDLFWGCTGFYENSCRYNMPFTPEDINLFTNTSRPEFQLSANQFNNIVMNPSSQKLIEKRVSDLKNEKIENYTCAVHGIELVLREKHNAIGLLDQYFLGCPLWDGTDNGCNYVMKLKSGAQLSSLLESSTGRGIL